MTATSVLTFPTTSNVTWSAADRAAAGRQEVRQAGNRLQEQAGCRMLGAPLRPTTLQCTRLPLPAAGSMCYASSSSSSPTFYRLLHRVVHRLLHRLLHRFCHCLRHSARHHLDLQLQAAGVRGFQQGWGERLPGKQRRTRCLRRRATRTSVQPTQ